MAREVEFHFDVGSPAAYLAWTQLPRTAEQAGATVACKPFLLGGVFGAPTFFVGEDMYRGQDRLDFGKEALQ